MWELIKFVIPKIVDKWEILAYCMRYEPGQVQTFMSGGYHDPQECCKKLFIDWITTDHGPTPKTYRTLLHHLKEINELTAATEIIERDLIQGKDKQYS